MYLPIGDPNANYALVVSVQVRDIYGAVTYYNLSTITVRIFLFIFILNEIFFYFRSSQILQQ
jgi:hypothetical protein